MNAHRVTVHVYGAGSAGCHQAHAFSKQGCEVFISDSSSEALLRAEHKIFPSRYGITPENISFVPLQKLSETPCEIAVVATPPDSHLTVALEALKHNPHVILVEKPFCLPHDPHYNRFLKNLLDSSSKLLIGFNLHYTEAFQFLLEKLKENSIGKVFRIDVSFREHSDYILQAHPWMSSLKDSYLGSTERGGGSFLEHSHALGMWLFLSEIVQLEEVVSVFPMRNRGGDYDTFGHVCLQSRNNFLGIMSTDFVSRPALKLASIFGENGTLNWQSNYRPGEDAVEWLKPSGDVEVFRFSKERSQDFLGQAKAIVDSLKGGDSLVINGLDFILRVQNYLKKIYSNNQVRQYGKSP